MAFQGAPFPSREVPLEPETRLFVPALLTWFRNIRQAIDATPSQITTPVTLTAQSASIGVTPIPSDPLAPGLYSVTYYARITTAAVTSSSLTVTLFWTDGGVSCTHAFTALTGNTVSTTGSDSYLLRIDQATPISYSTTYASNGAGEMVYSLDLVLLGQGDS